MAASALLIRTVEAGSLTLFMYDSILSHRWFWHLLRRESRFAKPCYRDILRVILVSTPSLVKTDASYIAAVLIPIELCASTRYSSLQ